MHRSGSEEVLAVIGAGPAGLRAAEVATEAGARVLVCDAQASAGRKFLVAGRGGLNLTHSEAVANFPARYRDEPGRWADLLAEFGPDAMRAWAEQLEVETYVGSSRRIFPKGQKAAVLLRAWLRRLQAAGVQFRFQSRLLGLTREGKEWRLRFSGEESLRAAAVVLALGGASWPETGSDGAWPSILSSHGVVLAPFIPANCGWNVAWPESLLTEAEGFPLKNLQVSAGEESVSGELLITHDGLEGGAIYRLGPVLRELPTPVIKIDFKPQVAAEALRQRALPFRRPEEWWRCWKLSPAAIALLRAYPPDDPENLEAWIAWIKGFLLRLEGPRPLAEAISTAGGVCWSELTSGLMLEKMPGVFLAGEMIDWEAPTGGYLLQGCFSTGTRAGRAAAKYLENEAA